ncbi:MAG: exo-alpha-sialidase [Planctomycetes bacterium]|nr:exo-alpha-sialidase [Planctomycetota bacterium]
MTASTAHAQPIINGVQINTDSRGRNIVGDAANEPSFAVSPVDPYVMVVGWRQFDTISSDVRYAGYALSWDGGWTWMNGGTLDPPPEAGPDYNQSDPVLAVDESGSFFYNGLMWSTPQNGLMVYRSDDGGANWQDPIYVNDRGADKNWYTVDRSGVSRHHYCIWGPSRVKFMRSTDEGVTWPRLFIYMDGTTMSYVSVGPDGAVYVSAWENGVHVQRSDNASDPTQDPEFTDSAIVDLGVPPFYLPVNPAGASCQTYVEADYSGGKRDSWVYLLSSGVPDDDVCDVFFARSTDRGDTWSDRIRVNDDPDPNDYQWMAAMSVSRGGRIDAVWFDTRDDPGHFMSRLYYSYSYDGGLTWAPNRPLTDAFDPSLGYPNQDKIGDYFQCQSDNGGVGVVYPATFNGEQDIYFRRANPILLEADQMIGGQNAEIRITGAKPNANTYLAYSRHGRSRTNVPPLDVDVELENPVRLGDTARTNAQGEAAWVVPVPLNATGQTVWLQSIQYRNASNVIKQTVQ